MKPLLAAAQGLKRGSQHPLPWYPPVCVTLADIPEGPRAYDHVQSMRDRTKIPLRLYDAAMKDVSIEAESWLSVVLFLVFLIFPEGPRSYDHNFTAHETGQRYFSCQALQYHSERFKYVHLCL